MSGASPTGGDAHRLQVEMAKITAADGALLAYAPEELGPCVGSRVSGRFRPREVCSALAEFTLPPRQVMAAAFRVVQAHGELVSGMQENSPYPRVSGVFRSGWFGGVTAVVHCEMTLVHGDNCAMTLTGVAREGLFNQHGARRAVRRLARRLHQTVGA